MELTFENLIKIILGVLVFVIVVVAVYFFFRNHFFEVFKGGEESLNILLYMFK